MMNIPRLALAIALTGSVFLPGAAESAETYPCEPFKDEKPYANPDNINTDVHNNSTKTLDVQIWRGNSLKKSVVLEPGKEVRHKAGTGKGGGTGEIVVRFFSKPSAAEGGTCRYLFDDTGRNYRWMLPEGESDVCSVTGLKIACQVSTQKSLKTEFRVSDPD
jgi:hypothetical protein